LTLAVSHNSTGARDSDEIESIMIDCASHGWVPV